ncbi:MAG: PASTA domain-containing protein [Candidatus Riflebacteria bacterium]|nr:PASTA domain-containing protein [Candidatus Riflebacteria bacterium]
MEVKRGAILDRNGNELAISVETYTLYVYTPETKSLEETANLLTPFLPLSKEQILEKIQKRRGYIPVQKNIEQPVAVKISALKIPGIILEENFRRVYPQNKLASNLIGFAGGDGTGLEGLELKFDKTLRGYPGIAVQGGVSYGEEGANGLKIIKNPAGGSNLILSIDSMIQHILETELAKMVEKYQPIDATAIVMDPYTGEVLGMACLPNYDPNKYADSAPDTHRNRPLVDFFEPGSCMKIFTAACGIMSGKINDSSHFFCAGHAEVMGKRIKCHGSHGSVDIYGAIAQSCNASMIQISTMLEPRQMYKLLHELGFGAPTEIEAPSETQGLLYPPSKWSGLSAASLSIGQEIAITGIQLVRAYSAIANGGWIMRPHLVKSIVSQNNDMKEDFEPEKLRKVFSDSLAEKLRRLLIGVVEHGTGEAARVEGYSVGGKTSTAQKANPAGGYYSEKVVTSFVGIVPGNKPRFVLFVAANEPKGEEKLLMGGKVAGPVFGIIADRILKYLRVPPEKPLSIDSLASGSLVASLPKLVEVKSTEKASSTKLVEKNSDKNSDKNSEKNSEKGSEKVSEKNSEKNSEKLADKNLDKNSEKKVAKTASSTRTITLEDFVPPDSTAKMAHQIKVVPDFTGLTLKEVASKARNLAIPVQLVGNGVAVEQAPKAGVSTNLAESVTVKFSPGGI